MYRNIGRIGVAAVVGALWIGGCTGDIGDGGAPALPEGVEPSEAPLMKLSTRQYRNTVRDLLEASGLGSVLATVQPFVDSVPDDSTETFSGLDGRIATEHMNGYFNVARAVGDAVEADTALLEAVAGSCATESSLSASCVDGFLDGFGRRAFRRPLTAEEKARYAELNDGVRPPAEAIRAMVLTFMMSPPFLNHLEVAGPAFEGERVFQLTNFELASRLSYLFWETMPDDELLDAAANGSLATDEGYAAAVDRIFEDPRTQETLWQFWTEWFRLDRFAGFQSSRPAFQALAEGENVGEPGRDHYGDMVQEVRDLTNLIAWDREGTMADLLSTDASVTSSEDLAKLYGVDPYSGSGDYGALPAGERAGILQRAALLANPLEQTNPFHRGAFIRRYILCDALPSPDPNALPPGSLDPPPLDVTSTTRERFEAKVVDNPLCEGCHGSFSDIGYVFEAYDALGRYREIEKVFDEQNGDLLGELPIDTSAPAQIEYSDETLVEGPADLNQRIIESGKVQSCLAKQYFSFAMRRKPGNASGDTGLRAEMAVPEATLKAVFKQVALHPSFKIRKVGSP